jgi:hypothetical protein
VKVRATIVALALEALACGESGAPAPASGCLTSGALWAASDYSSSAVGSLALAGPITSTVGRVDLGADPALAVSRGRAFLVARDADLVFEVTPRCGMPVSRWSVHQASRAGSSNPQDVAVASDGSLWIPLYSVPSVVVVAPSGDVARTIDLSAYDGDGNPNASAIAIVDTPSGEKAFVALERLNDKNGYKSEQPSWMLRIDVASGAVEAHVELAGRNPFGMYQDRGLIWLAEPGNFNDATEPLAGIERFDPSTSTTALVVHETDLGGSVAQVAVSAGCGAAIVANATPNLNATSLVTFDPQSGLAIAPLSRAPIVTGGFDLEGLQWVGGALAVGDRRRAGAGYPVHVFDATPACALTERRTPVYLPLSPVAVRVVR